MIHSSTEYHFVALPVAAMTRRSSLSREAILRKSSQYSETSLIPISF